VYIPENSVIVSEALKDLHTQTDAVSDPKTKFKALLSSWFAGFTWWKRY
jgi:hypothetical protein